MSRTNGSTSIKSKTESPERCSVSRSVVMKETVAAATSRRCSVAERGDFLSQNVQFFIDRRDRAFDPVSAGDT